MFRKKKTTLEKTDEDLPVGKRDYYDEEYETMLETEVRLWRREAAQLRKKVFLLEKEKNLMAAKVREYENTAENETEKAADSSEQQTSMQIQNAILRTFDKLCD